MTMFDGSDATIIVTSASGAEDAAIVARLTSVLIGEDLGARLAPGMSALLVTV